MNKIYLPFSLLLLTLLITGCQSSIPLPTESSTPSEGSSPTSPPSSTPISDVTLDLSERPLIWFHPLATELNGSLDYMALFQSDAPWQDTVKHIDVIRLDAEWVADFPWHDPATDEELKQIIGFANQNGIALAISDAPIVRPDDCGTGIESFFGPEEGLRVSMRIKRLGGTIQFVAFDAPFAYTRFVQGENACYWSYEKTAGQINDYILAVRSIFPNVKFGDIEPMWAWVSAEDYRDWLDAFRQVNGYDLEFIHLDLDYDQLDWAEKALTLENYARERGIDFGIIYMGNELDTSDENWTSSAGERVKIYELDKGGDPDHIIFQSWHDRPDYVLPEIQRGAFTYLINQYFLDKTLLGFRTEGPGANLAFRKEARASSILSGSDPLNAVDGSPGTSWSAGDFAPQWIEIDLGAAYTISEIRLLASQSPAGRTVNRVLGKGPETSNQLIELHVFDGVTDELELLRFAPATPWEGIQYIRIHTTMSPSWISWREIDIISAE